MPSFRPRPESITPAEYESFAPGCKSGEKTVSLDKSLKMSGGMARTRNVLKRHERVEKLSTEDRWDESQSVLGLPKTKIVKTTVGKKKKKKKKEEEEE
jgi:small basic protein (TIGR04137 family)